MDSNFKTLFHPRHLRSARDTITTPGRNCGCPQPPFAGNANSSEEDAIAAILALANLLVNSSAAYDPPRPCVPTPKAVPSIKPTDEATPTSPASAVIQCGGTTLNLGKRCARTKTLSAVDAQGGWFCHDHKNHTGIAHDQPGYYARIGH